MLKELDNCDWPDAFACAMRDRIESVLGAKAEPSAFGLEDVAELIGVAEGENDERDWVCAGLLKDGRWFRVSAWCDYTGWGCQDGGNAVVADSKEDLIRLGMSEEERKRLGVTL